MRFRLLDSCLTFTYVERSSQWSCCTLWNSETAVPCVLWMRFRLVDSCLTLTYVARSSRPHDVSALNNIPAFSHNIYNILLLPQLVVITDWVCTKQHKQHIAVQKYKWKLQIKNYKLKTDSRLFKLSANTTLHRVRKLLLTNVTNISYLYHSVARCSDDQSELERLTRA